MLVCEVKSGIVSASNGGCDAFDVNRSLAASVAELNPFFSKTPLSMLVLGIIVTQSPGRRFLPAQPSWPDLTPQPHADAEEGA